MPDLDMGTYAAFVWPAWGLSALVLGGLVVRASRAARHWSRDLAALEAAAVDPTGPAA
ncbi:MAG: heme exporter protein D [Brevundimonas sp.]|jgi:heme exporter protein D|uniref:heme exporter protein CcmD n=1 Tax=Brevundimonas sp. TaxID=1871086 RepID=UPI002489FEFA|nr:heme exporter protein CcmD [Brevundimonas sp.]MDI1280421.1 heme exporter protein CcmD [Brevundimonas sp.]